MMNSKDFDVFLDEIMAQEEAVLKSKEAEYATDASRFHNFEIAARITGDTRERTAWGMALKHLVSVTDCIHSADKMTGGRIPPREVLREKFGDLRNYLALIEGMLNDTRDEAERQRNNVAFLEDALHTRIAELEARLEEAKKRRRK